MTNRYFDGNNPTHEIIDIQKDDLALIPIKGPQKVLEIAIKEIKTPPQFCLKIFHRETQQIDTFTAEANDLHDIGVGVLVEPYDKWDDLHDSVAFCITESINKQEICARFDDWSKKTEIDKDGGLCATLGFEQEFRGQPGTVIIKNGNTMIKTTNIDALLGTSGAPLMLVDEKTMNVKFEKEVEFRDKKMNQRKLIGDYQTLSVTYKVS